MLPKFPYNSILWGLVIIFLVSCSSSSQSDRYNRPAENESDESPSSVRFTSKEKKSDKEDEVFYPNISDSLSEFDEVPVEDHPVDTKEFVGKYSKIESFSAALTTREKILFEIINYLDTPYLYGGITKNGIDCSAFTQKVFTNSIGLDLPRTAKQQFKVGKPVGNKSNLVFGDLLFFNTTSRSYPGHVGIYIGENLFAHASRSLGVTVSSLKSTYYKTRYIGARRVK